jgi:branched-chain amino acid transport system permease protein
MLVYLNQFISPSSAHLTASAIGVLQAILGGMGTLVGPVIGSFLIVFIRNVVSQYLERWPTLLGLTFIVVILFARRGIVGALSRGWRSWLLRRYGEETTRADKLAEPGADVALGAKTSGPS